MAFQSGNATMPGRGGSGLAARIVEALNAKKEGESIFIPLADFAGDPESLTGTLFHPAKDAGYRVLVRSAVGAGQALKPKDWADKSRTGTLVWRREKYVPKRVKAPAPATS